MAATVESAFVLIDRASPTIREIRRELRALQADAQKAGKSLDDLSGPRVARQMENSAREMRVLGNETDTTSRKLDNADQSMRRTEGRLGSLSAKTKDAHLNLSVLGKVISSLKWPALIAGAGGALQILTSLGAGAVALLPKMLDLSGAAAGVGAAYIGAGAAFGVFKLATHGLTQALAGNKKALAALTPEGRAFLQVIKSMHPELQRLRSTAQRGLFPGLSTLLTDLKAQAPQIRAIVGQTAKDLGGLGVFLGQQITKPGFMRDLRSLSDQGARAFGSAARGGFHFASALEQVLLAAQPFTDWLGNAFVHLGKLAQQEAFVGRQTGTLQAFFDRTKSSLQTMGDIGKNVFEGLRGVMEAARGQSNSLWGSIDQLSQRFANWSTSMKGQSSMRTFFDNMRPILHDTVQLLGMMVKGLGSLTQGSQATQMIDAMKQAGPAIGQALQSIVTNFGPAVVQSLSSVVGLVADLAGNAGPLTLVARAVGTVASAADHLVHALGPLGPAIATAFGTYALLRKMKAFDAIDTLRAKWFGVAAAADGATAAETRAASIGVMGGAPAVVPAAASVASRSAAAAEATAAAEGALVMRSTGPWRGVPNVMPVTQTASGLSVAEESLLAGGGGGAAAKYLAGRNVLSGEAAFKSVYPGGRYGAPALGEISAGAGGDVGLLGKAGAFGSKAVGVLGRVALPIAGISALLGAIGTQGNLGTKLQGALSSATLGLIPGPQSASQVQGAAAKAVAPFTGLPLGGLARQRRSIGSIRSQLTDLQSQHGHGGGLLGAVQSGPSQADLTAQTRVLQTELKRREAILHQSQMQVDHQLAAESVQHAQALTTDFVNAFGILKRANGPEAAMKETVGKVLGQMRTMRPAGAKVLDDSMLAWAQQQAKNNPKLRGIVKQLTDGIKSDFSNMGKHVQIVNGQVLTGSQTEWKQIEAALSTQTEKAREQVSQNFTAIQQEALGSLTAMGFTNSQATQIIQGHSAQLVPGASIVAGAAQSASSSKGTGKGKKRATGGRAAAFRLPGTGTLDTVMMPDGGMGAPGELVLNHWTERDVDLDLARAGRPPLEQRVRRETRPHYRPQRSWGPSSRATGGATGSRSGYVYPFGAVEPMSRVDQGLDYTGVGPIYALGSGHVTYSGLWPGWPGTGGVVYQLDSGQYAGRKVYNMEHVIQSVRQGQHVNAGQVIGKVLSGYPWLEAGWANSSGTGPATPYNGAADGTPMPAGQQFKAFMLALKGGGKFPTGGAFGGGGSVAQHMKALRAPMSNLGGVPGALVNRAGQMYAAGLTKKINAQIGGGSGGQYTIGNVGALSSLDHVFPANGGTTFSPALVARIANWAGLPGQTFAQIAHGESSYQPGAVEHPEASGAQGFGLWQITTNVGNDAMIAKFGGPTQMLNPLKNAKASKLLYDAAGGISPWHGTKYVTGAALGKRIGEPVWGGWNAHGADVTVNRPTVFGAGEAGPEHVRITPAGGGHGGGVTIHHGAVQVNAAGGDRGALQRYVDKRLHQFAEEVAAEIEAGAEEPGSVVMG